MDIHARLTSPSAPGTALSPQREPEPGTPGSTSQTDAPVDWNDLVARVARSEPSGMEDLYRLFSKGVRFLLYRQLGPQDLDDKVHDTFLIVVQAIRKGDLREPERLMGFVRTIVRRQVAAHIDHAVHDRKERADLEAGNAVLDHRHDPEQAAMIRQRDEIMEKVLRGISSRDREILTRFYLNEESQEDICRKMNLTETQFRLLKSRAKARFGELGRRRIEPRRAWFFRR